MSSIIRGVDGLIFLFDSLEKALKHRAARLDTWWKTSEPSLRVSKEKAFRYLVLEAYKENIQANVPGIEAQLTDSELFRYGRLDHELGELMQAAYPMISNAVQETNQTVILSLYADEDWDGDALGEWSIHAIYQYLVWIPGIFRTPQTQAFIDTWMDRFGSALPTPHIHSWGGFVGPPLSSQDMLDLSDSALFRLLHHYNDSIGTERTASGGLVGGRDLIRRVLGEASSRHPDRFLALFARIIDEDLHQDYVHAIINGVSNHLRYRFGNLRPSGDWIPIEPVPDGDVLAAALLNLIERYPIIWESGWAIAHALEACCEILDDPEQGVHDKLHRSPKKVAPTQIKAK